MVPSVGRRCFLSHCSGVSHPCGVFHMHSPALSAMQMQLVHITAMVLRNYTETVGSIICTVQSGLQCAQGTPYALPSFTLQKNSTSCDDPRQCGELGSTHTRNHTPDDVAAQPVRRLLPRACAAPQKALRQPRPQRGHWITAGCSRVSLRPRTGLNLDVSKSTCRIGKVGQ
jgi:hypothetical protein